MPEPLRDSTRQPDDAPSGWTRRAVIVGTCAAVGVGIRVVDQVLNPWKYDQGRAAPTASPVAAPAASDPVRAQDYHALTPMTLPWAMALSVAPDQDLVDRRETFLAVVQRNTKHKELTSGALRLAELALAGRHEDPDNLMMTALSALSGLGCTQAIEDLRQRIARPDAFPNSQRFFQRKR